MDALPAVFALENGEWDTPLIALLAEEMAREEPGQQAVLDRLFELLLIAAIRAHLARLGDDAPAWYRAHHDPVVGRAVRMLHENPSRRWTVAALAAGCGTSRARFVRRFSQLVGEPPMGYLMRWPLALAADLLREPQLTVETVATQVGSSNGFALSSAFKRVRAVSPTSYRRQ